MTLCFASSLLLAPNLYFTTLFKPSTNINNQQNIRNYCPNILEKFKKTITEVKRNYSLLYSDKFQFRKLITGDQISYRPRTDKRYFTKYTEPQKTSIKARLVSTIQESPSIISLLFDVSNDQKFTFKPGQWCDIYIPKLDSPGYLVAGFSMVSSPLLQNQVEFSVKLSKHPVSLWMHNTIKPGDEILINGGYGDFYYSREMGDDLVLIGGGIGITPLMSILQYVRDAKYPDVTINMLHSAVTSKELLFRNKIQNIEAKNSNIHYIPTITKPDNEWQGRFGRINANLLKELKLIGNKLYFICGPLEMVNEIKKILTNFGIEDSKIKYEKWW